MISVCMIARNEESIIGVSIASTNGLADEVVVFDTGSEDNTVEEAGRAGARVLEGGDRMNKAEARNYACSKAQGDWVVILDCDEKIADPCGLREFLETTDADAVYCRQVYIDANDKRYLEHSRMLCWRSGTMEYKYRAHEVPMPPDGKWPKTAYTDFVFEHRPAADGNKWKLQYTLDRLLLDVQDYPKDARPMFYLGRQYTYLSQWKKGLEWLGKYLHSDGWRDRADAWKYSAQCHAGLGNRSEQIGALYRACEIMPRRRDWWGMLAEIYHKDGKDNIAVGLLKYALEQPPPKGTYYNHHWFGAHIYDIMAVCMWKLERHAEGLGYAEKALSLVPGNTRLQENVRYFRQSRFSQLERCVPELYVPGKLLYVGAQPVREPEALKSMRRVGHEVTLFEIWHDNAEHYRERGIFDHVIEGDVREIGSLGLSQYDAILWWHGPEHVDIQDLPNTLVQLESLSDIVVLGCPWGVMKQAAIYGNPNERHRTHLLAEDFPPNYSVDTIGEVDARSGHLIAWRING